MGNTEITNTYVGGSNVVSSKYVSVNIFLNHACDINHAWDIQIWTCCCWVKHFLITFFDTSDHSKEDGKYRNEKYLFLR